ncbi:hypothetical protein HII31_09953 [Pseudocercospora fuligena]|uniref:Uncharacterized protein n=1 Tax=Pseudocercospora fuligena TaxID=685502 RepID=A0A8H6R9X9_9PEZI|nr:hypothetical protein HII31_09953 [Pseudocercospora fuligena]
MEPIRRTNMPRPRSGLSEISEFDFDNASILRGGPRRRADTNSSGSASQHNAPKRSNPFSLFTSGPTKALSNIFSNKRRKKHHTSAGPEYGVIPDNQARPFRAVITSRDAEELRLHNAQESVKEPAPSEQYPIFTFGQQQPGISTQTQFTFGPPLAPVPPQPQTQARPGKMKQAQRGLAKTARQMFRSTHSKKDSKDLMPVFDPRLNGDVENTTSVYGSLQHDGSNNHTHGHPSDAQTKFLDQVRQAGSMLAGKRKDQHERSESRSRKRARDQSDWHDLEISEESPPGPVPPGFIERTTSISVDTHIGLDTEEYNVPPPHVYQMHQQQPPAPVPIMPAMPDYQPYMTGQYFQTAYQNFYDPHAITHAFGEQAGYLAQHQSHQLPPIAEDELAEREEEELECLRYINDKRPSVPYSIQQRDHATPAQTLHDEGVGHSEQASHQDQMNGDEQSSPSQDRYRSPDIDDSSMHELSSMDEDYNGTRSPVSSLSDTEMMQAGDEELSRKDRLSVAANRRAIAELDDERESLRQQFEKFSWCHGQEKEFGAYTSAADRGATFRN